MIEKGQRETDLSHFCIIKKMDRSGDCERDGKQQDELETVVIGASGRGIQKVRTGKKPGSAE